MKATAEIAFVMAVGLTASATLAHGGGGSASDISGDAASGETVFRKCQACHAVGEGARSSVGPQLNGVLGRQIASVESFNYSNVFQAMGEEDTIWTPEELSAFLEAPRDYASGTKMAFAGLDDEADRQDVIAYLASFNAR